MLEKARQRQRAMWLLRIHHILYFTGWTIAVYALSRLQIAEDSFSIYTHFIALILFWTPLLALHTGLQVFSNRWNDSDERMIYRQGYADALRQFTERAFSEQETLDEQARITEVHSKRRI